MLRLYIFTLHCPFARVTPEWLYKYVWIVIKAISYVLIPINFVIALVGDGYDIYATHALQRNINMNFI